MGTTNKPRSDTKPPVVREYDIGETRFIVTASVKAGAREDAAAKVRRLIRKEIKADGRDVLPDKSAGSG